MLKTKIGAVEKLKLNPLDLLPQDDIREKIIDLLLKGVPRYNRSEPFAHLEKLYNELTDASVENVKVVVFGGGTGLSNLIGGDSRLKTWGDNPFSGLKEIFPKTKSVVCITDNGGSTGELLKDLPLIAIGDIRHVLLSSIQKKRLVEKYSLNENEAIRITSVLADIFNYRYEGKLKDAVHLLAHMSSLDTFPRDLKTFLSDKIELLFSDPRLDQIITRGQCLGNLIIISTIYSKIPSHIDNQSLANNQRLFWDPILNGLNQLCKYLGVGEDGVLPCSPTPAQLRIQYSNGLEAVGEHKLTVSRRGFPVSSVFVDYFDDIKVYKNVIKHIEEADIIVLAPGSLYSSIIPVLKVPEMASSIRSNKKALKVLVSNLWVQTGETDISVTDPERKFYVSDMIKAYEKNIPGGIDDLFNEVLCISLKDIPASVLQNYAVEEKIPIYLDKDKLRLRGYHPIECGVYSTESLKDRGVIQHDPGTLAQAIKGLYLVQDLSEKDKEQGGCTKGKSKESFFKNTKSRYTLPCERYECIKEKLSEIEISCVGDTGGVSTKKIQRLIQSIFWNHPVIPPSHLNYFTGIQIISRELWERDQKWDNVFSFYDPEDGIIKIRAEQGDFTLKFEIGFLIALGESLLGNYALNKSMRDVAIDSFTIGRVYELQLRPKDERSCYFSDKELNLFLTLTRMHNKGGGESYSRLINANEGFTPPGLFMGLMYAWYIDNRFATHIEYKMSILRIGQTDLIPEQMKMVRRRKKMINFYKEIVFSY